MYDFIFALCIAPLQGAMSYVLGLAHALTASYGFSIVLLSLCVNIALIPVYHLAESWQEDERALQNKMAAKMAEIRVVYSGRERDLFIRAIHRMYGYHPILALRTSLGLLIQIPFFFAAYSLLHGHPALQGVEFLFIHNLGKPDALFAVAGHYINIMPFVMTGINLLSAAVYSSRLSKRDKIQLYVLAALFLVLLYTADAGLLLYWTCNNIFSFFKNIVYSRFIYTDTRSSAPEWFTGIKTALTTIPRMAVRLLSKLPAWFDIALIGGAVTCTILGEVIWKRQFIYEVMIAALALALLACAVRRVHIKSKGDTLLADLQLLFLLLAVMLAVSLPLVFSAKKFATARATYYTLTYSATLGCILFWLLSRQPLSLLFKRMAAACKTGLAGRKATSLFTPAVLLNIVLAFIYVPATLYASDPAFFFDQPSSIAGTLLFKVLVVSGVTALIFRHAGPGVKGLFAVAGAWGALCALTYAFVAVVDYGPMNNVTFQDLKALYSDTGAIIDAAVILGTLAVLLVITRTRKLAALGGVFQALTIVMCLLSGWQFITAPPQPETQMAQEPGSLPVYNERLLGFSKSGKNIVVLMLDSFTGTHASLLFEEDPELKNKFDGFTWYSDTVSSGNATPISMPGIMGGPAYDPYNYNQRANMQLTEMMQEAYSVLPNAFIPAGYDVSLANINDLNPELMAGFCPRVQEALLIDNVDYAYTAAWRMAQGPELNASSDQTSFMMAFGLFKTAPVSLRRHIYGGGLWLRTANVVRDNSEGAYAMLDLMASASNSNAPQSTLKVISNMLPHPDWRINENCMPSSYLSRTMRPDGIVQEYYQAERCTLNAISRWFEWLKQNNLYDNTQIILLSDHSSDNGSIMQTAEFKDMKSDFPFIARPTALLMVKNFNERHDLATSLRPMSSSDITALICRESENCSGINYEDPIALPEDTPRERYHTCSWPSLRRHDPDRYVGITYSVNGPQFKRESWNIKHRWDTQNDKKEQ